MSYSITTTDKSETPSHQKWDSIPECNKYYENSNTPVLSLQHNQEYQQINMLVQPTALHHKYTVKYQVSQFKREKSNKKVQLDIYIYSKNIIHLLAVDKILPYQIGHPTSGSYHPLIAFETDDGFFHGGQFGFKCLLAGTNKTVLKKHINWSKKLSHRFISSIP